MNMPKKIKSKIVGLGHHPASSLYRDHHQHYMESAAITKLGVQPHHSSPSTSSIQTPPGSSGKQGSTGSSSDGDHHHNNHNHHQQHHHLHNNLANSQSGQALARQRTGAGGIGGVKGVNSYTGNHQKGAIISQHQTADDQSSGLTTTTMSTSSQNQGTNGSGSGNVLAGGHHHHLSGGVGGGSRSLNGESCGGRFLLGVLFTIAEFLLFSCITIWLYWSYQHDDGLAWNQDRKQQFNLHATLMLLGFIFLNGQAMLVYRSFQCCNKIYTKILHTILFVMSTSAISLGVILAYNAQENVGIGNKPIMHFYSLHAWIGLVTVSLFVLQFVFGFTSFLILLCCDRATSRYRAALLPIHRTFGLTIFSLAISTCFTGLLQTARSRLSSKLGKIDYHELSEAGLLVNAIGVCLIGLAILIPYIIMNSSNKRIKSDRLRLSQLDMRI